MKVRLFAKGPSYSKKRALAYLAISVFFTFLIGWGILQSYLFIGKKQKGSSKVPLDRIVQAGKQFQALPTLFFAEKLGLCIDHPTLFGSFSCSKAQERLMESHIFEKITVKKIKPHTVFIDYTLKTPIAYSGEYANTLVNLEGDLFPADPFFFPKRLPKLFFGELFSPTELWGKKISEPKMQLVRDILELCKNFSLLSIDVSQADCPTLGKRQCVVILERGNNKHVLRLTPKNYHKEIQHYFTLQEKFLKEENHSLIIDLRLQDLVLSSIWREEG